MKIAFWHFHTFRLYRGIETLVLSLSNELAKKGHEVSIVGGKAIIEPLVKQPPEVKTYLYPVSPYFAYQFIIPFYFAHFLKYRYDHVIAFFSDFGEGRTLQALKPFVKIPLTLFLCYPVSNAPHRYTSFKRYEWDSYAQALIADSKWIAKEAETFLKKPVGVVPVGADPGRFKSNPDLRRKMRQQFGYQPDDVVLLNVSSLEKQKGTWRVVEALGRLKKQAPHLHYFILGKGQDEQRLRQRVVTLGLEKNVRFGGETTELEAYYNMADIFVMLPDAEGNSVAWHEAMSCGLPVIAANTEGFRENISENTACLVSANESDEIDNAILKLLNNKNYRKDLGEKGKQHIAHTMSWDNSAEQLLKSLSSNG